MNNTLKRVELWCNNHSLSVNPAKTTMVAFTRKKNIEVSLVTFYGQTLQCSREVKYLGVILDEN